jgi:hypothetical protein
MEAPRLSLPATTSRGEEAFPEAVLRAVERIKAHAEVSALIADLEAAVDVQYAHLRRSAGDALFHLEKLRQLGAPVDVNDLVGEFEQQLTKVTECLERLSATIRRARRSSSADALVLDQVEKTAIPAAAKLQGELAETIRLILEAGAKNNGHEDSLLSRALTQYANAIRAVEPLAEIPEFRVVRSDGGFTLALTVKLISPPRGRHAAIFEERIHDIVEAADPSLVGVFAIEYRQP